MMFYNNILKHHWFPLLSSSELHKNKIINKQFFNKDIIIYKSPNNSVFIKSRYCPHRNADMTLGRVSDSCITCPYHGWEFDNSNACVTKIPSCNSTFIDKISLEHYYVHVDDDIIWCYFGDNESCPISTPVYDTFEDFHITSGFRVMNCNWMRVIENSIDPSHPNFVHQNTFSGNKSTKIKYIKKPTYIKQDNIINSVVQIYHESTIPYFDSNGFIHIYFKIELPNTVVISFKRKENNILTIITAVPLSDTETLIYWRFGQDFVISENLKFFINTIITYEMNKVLDEDQNILDSLQENNNTVIYSNADLIQLIYHNILKNKLKEI